MENILEKDTSSRFTSIISLVALLAFFPMLLMGVYQTTVLLTRAFGVNAEIIVDTQAVLETINTDFIHAYSQGGEEAKDMIGPVKQEVTALKPKYIRLDHIYDHHDVVHRSGDSLSYDFSRLDQAVQTILATGAKPVLALSFMPAVIAKDGVIINPPNDWNEWAQVVRRTIEHYSGKGEMNIAEIYYEVWNEPDLDQFGKWHYSNQEKNYMTLYRYASQGAQQAQNVHQFYLGGPSTTGLYKNWIIALIKSGYRVDFLSWHSYLEDPTKFAKDQRNIANWLMTYPAHILKPKLITEYGFTGAKDGRYNTKYAAAHTAAVVRQLISGQPTFMFAFELKDGPGQTDGWGLIGHEGSNKQKKPRYHVYNFIDNMVGKRLALEGEGSWVTGFASIRDDVYRVFLVNFDQKGTHAENVPVTFINLEPGDYEYREWFLQGRDVTFPETVSTENPTLIREVFMPAQSIAILEVRKK
ncbi:hypothetical protein ACFL1P_00915 [Patescibacteria group bacterium]